MYKYLLCWRYLRTRYIALASIVSVLLGVATMIVVNSVMAGFAEKMRARLHGVLADVVVESFSLDGFQEADAVMARIREAAGDQIEAMAPTMELFGLMSIITPTQTINRQVQIIGIRPEERAKTGDFAEFIFDENDRQIAPTLDVPNALRMRSPAGEILQTMDPDDEMFTAILQRAEEEVPEHGAIVGYALATHHHPGAERDVYLAPPGSKVVLTFPSAGRVIKAVQGQFAVTGFFKSGMSEYDSMHVYVPLEYLQTLRGLGDGKGGGAVNQIQIKAKPGVDIDALSEKVRQAIDPMRPMFFIVRTWEQKQGPLLAAVAIEQSILNILLFFIIAVAGFGILAIFSMIVVEKTRDIGILKSLGASTAGIRGIFLGYGLSLGLVGSGIGMLIGLLFVWKINSIEEWLSSLTGHKVFDDSIYYFKEIPTLVEPFTVAWIVGGALFIAVAASVWPAQRAARLHPVQALRND
jgi:lipoprotein-releasing system permease protein